MDAKPPLGVALHTAARHPPAHALNPDFPPEALDSPTFSASHLFPPIDADDDSQPYVLDLPPPAFAEGYTEIVKTRYYSRGQEVPAPDRRRGDDERPRMFPESVNERSSSFGRSALPSRRPYTHPVYLSPARDGGEDGASLLEGKTPYTRVEAYIEADAAKQSDGVFVPLRNIQELGLRELGEHETRFGAVRRFEPAVLHFFTRHCRADVYALPEPLERHDAYRGGIVGIAHLWRVGLSVLIENGELFLQDPEASEAQMT